MLLPDQRTLARLRGRERRTDLTVAVVVAAVFLLPGIWYGSSLFRAAQTAAPFVDELAAEAEELGVELMPGSVLDIEMAPAEIVTQFDIDQRAVHELGRRTFDGDPVDGSLFNILTRITALVLAAWSLGGLVASLLMPRVFSVALALAAIATIGCLGAPLVIYGDVIDVVVYYTD